MLNSRIVFLPVDERFCTRDYFLLLVKAAGLNVITPEKAYLGAKKVPPDMPRLLKWLDNNVMSGDILIFSADMLAHGGLIPSRMSVESLETLKERLDLISHLRKRAYKIYASVSITRTPQYSSSEEEPDYWEYFGEKIYSISRLIAESTRGDSSDNTIFESISDIPTWVVQDYLVRRKRNFKVVSAMIDLVKEKEIDFLSIVLDDNSAGSISLAEADRHAELVAESELQDKVSIHAGADESTLTLLSRTLVDHFGIEPAFRTAYASPDKRDFIPPFEGTGLSSSVENHVASAGGKIADAGEDILLLINNPTEALDSPQQPRIPDDLSPYKRLMESYGNRDNLVAGIADVKYSNGADNYLVKRILEIGGIDWCRTNFSAWNTAGNTLGAVCAHSVIQLLGDRGLIHVTRSELEKLQAVFLLEHWAFQSNVRQELLKSASERGVLPWTVIPIEDWAEEFAMERLNPYKLIVEKAIGRSWKRMEVFFPWHRSFELGIVLL